MKFEEEIGKKGEYRGKRNSERENLERLHEIRKIMYKTLIL